MPCSGHLVKLLQKNPYIAGTFIADNCYSGKNFFWYRLTSSSQIYLFIAGTSYFWWKNKNDFYILIRFSELSNFCDNSDFKCFVGIKFHGFD